MRRSVFVLGGLVALVVAFAPAASADTTLGSLYGGPFQSTEANAYGNECSFTEAVYYESNWDDVSPSDVAPADGRITTWTVSHLPAGATFRLAILRHDISAETWTIERRSAEETIPSGSGVLSFATDLPIAAGEQIALDAVDVGGLGFCIYPTSDHFDESSVLDDRTPDGTPQDHNNGDAIGTLVNLEAHLTSADGNGAQPSGGSGTGSSSSGSSSSGSSSSGSSSTPTGPAPSATSSPQPGSRPSRHGRFLGLRTAYRLTARAAARLLPHPERRALRRCARRAFDDVICHASWQTARFRWSGTVEIALRVPGTWSSRLDFVRRRRACAGRRCTARVATRWIRHPM